jgi:mannose-6-phosphate isomerase-like protein (cupin superfamily)
MVRRVVTGCDTSGRPAVLADGVPPTALRRREIPGFADTAIWRTAATASTATIDDPTTSLTSWVPEPGETLALVVTFAPDSVFADPGFDPAAAREEHLQSTPGLAELFEPDGSGMHTTPTVDYGVVLSGRLVLDLDDGETVQLSAGDVVVQQALRHAWRNPFDEPAEAFFVLVGVRA